MSSVKTSLMVAAVASGLFTTSARAQKVITAKVPFAFTNSADGFDGGNQPVSWLYGTLEGLVFWQRALITGGILIGPAVAHRLIREDEE